MLLFSDVDGELRVGHLRLLIISYQHPLWELLSCLQENQMGSLQCRENQRFPDENVRPCKFFRDGLEYRNAHRTETGGGHHGVLEELRSDYHERMVDRWCLSAPRLRVNIG
jgi:hypothetical protein